VEHVVRLREMRNAYRSSDGKPEGRRRLWKSRSRWKDNIEIFLKGIWYEGMNWIHMAQD